MTYGRTFAIIPAAGQSVRMGQPKLLLPWRDRQVIDHVLAAWTSSQVTRTILVACAADTALVRECQKYDMDVITVTPRPNEMKTTVWLAIRHVEREYEPTSEDAWVLAPADMPTLTSTVIDTVIAAYRSDVQRVVAPVYQGRRGHPVLFPWQYAARVGELGPDVGINRLFDEATIEPLVVTDACVLQDLDTYEQYQELSRIPLPLPRGDKHSHVEPQ